MLRWKRQNSWTVRTVQGIQKIVSLFFGLLAFYDPVALTICPEK